MIRCRKVPLPEVGSQPSFTENSRIIMIPNQKWGMDSPNRAASMLTMSRREPLRTAETMPIGMETTSAMTMAASDSWRLAGSRSMINSMTGTL